MKLSPFTLNLMKNCFGGFSIILEIFVTYLHQLPRPLLVILYRLKNRWKQMKTAFSQRRQLDLAADGKVALLTLWGKTSELNILPVVYTIKCAKPTNDLNGLNSTPGTTFEVTMHYLKIKNTMFRNHVKWVNLMLPSKYCKLISFNHSILASQYYTFSHNRQCDIIHKSCGFEGDIPEYQPLGDTKAKSNKNGTHCS